uniref:G_PROTEIN_RECEP_F1_2 domain-containing protein n=1 Tax=Heterorhabditis bacteriophora TaxID=37862 RepID=A0A1I7XIP9_HETBA
MAIKTLNYNNLNSEHRKAQVLMFCMICVTLTSIEQLFFFRYQHILPFGDRFKMSRHKFILLILSNYIIWLILIGGTLYAAGPDQLWAREKFAKRYPQLSHLLEIPAFYTFDIDTDLSLQLFFLTYVGKITYSFIFIGSLIILSHKSLERTAMSHRAKIMQKKLIYTLCVQVSIPLVIFAIPCAVLIIPLVFSIPYMYRRLTANSLSAKATDSTPTHSRHRGNVNRF